MKIKFAKSSVQYLEYVRNKMVLPSIFFHWNHASFGAQDKYYLVNEQLLDIFQTISFILTGK